MQTRTISTYHPKAIPDALEVLKSGGLVAFPTDTVYGLGALAFDGKAIGRIYGVKERPDEKSIPILLADPDDLAKVSVDASPLALKLAARFWPGPMTLVVPKHPDLPDAVSSTPTVGVRVPDHTVARMLLHYAGPMAVTSANLSGQPSPVTAHDVLEQLDGRIDLILDGGQTPGGIPSTVVNCLGAEPVILRQGPIMMEHILKMLG
jgi:L-threonylcarbamoyladenylate synthase